jgi:hypothetical protein
VQGDPPQRLSELHGYRRGHGTETRLMVHLGGDLIDHSLDRPRLSRLDGKECCARPAAGPATPSACGASTRQDCLRIVADATGIRLAFDARIAGLSVQGWEAVVSLAEGALAAPR